MKVSDFDREGMGSISDIPLWSPDGRYFLLPVSQAYDPLNWRLIAADGSNDRQLTYGEGIPPRFLQQDFTPALWLPDGQGLVGYQTPGMMDSPDAQETAIVSLDLASGVVTSLTPTDWGPRYPIAWKTPGRQLWQMTGDSLLVFLEEDHFVSMLQYRRNV